MSKTFPNGFSAVRDLSLTIEDGEFIVLVGASGCGKTTLLRLIAGLEEASAGTISIGDKDVTDKPPRQRDVAMVFQSYALYPHMNVRQNLGYGLKVRRIRKAEARRRVEEVELLGLEELLDRDLRSSPADSGSAAMGRAIVREPKAFLMDEPLSNLDAKLRVGMRASLSELHARLGVTTVYVTHDQVEAMTLGQRVAVMRDGRILQVDRPQKLYEAPQDLFVAAFIGSPAMNLVEAKIDGDHVLFGQYRLPLDPARRPATAAKDIVLGIRPESFEDAPSRRPGCPRSTSRSPSSRSSAPTPACSSASTRRGSPPRCSRLRTRRRCSQSRRRSSAPGSIPRRARESASARAAVDPAAFHFFDRESGQALVAAVIARMDLTTTAAGRG